MERERRRHRHHIYAHPRSSRQPHQCHTGRRCPQQPRGPMRLLGQHEFLRLPAGQCPDTARCRNQHQRRRSLWRQHFPHLTRPRHDTSGTDYRQLRQLQYMARGRQCKQRPAWQPLGTGCRLPSHRHRRIHPRHRRQQRQLLSGSHIPQPGRKSKSQLQALRQLRTDRPGMERRHGRQRRLQP